MTLAQKLPGTLAPLNGSLLNWDLQEVGRCDFRIGNENRRSSHGVMGAATCIPYNSALISSGDGTLGSDTISSEPNLEHKVPGVDSARDSEGGGTRKRSKTARCSQGRGPRRRV